MPSSGQGSQYDRYSLIPRTLVFLTSGRYILLIRGAPSKKLWPNLYNGIGGHVEQGEDVLTAARREILEEAGISPSELWLCGIITVDTSSKPGICIFVIRGTLEHHNVLNSGDIFCSSEGMLEWVPIDKIYDLPLVEDLPVLLPHVLSMDRSGNPFIAQYSYDHDDKLVITFAR